MGDFFAPADIAGPSVQRALWRVTGLSIIRTSVDHGTIFDVAGKGIADARGLAEAIRASRMMVAANG